MPYIKQFSIEALNNFFTYTDCKIAGLGEDLIILYGDNGSGKTTILNLIFHLLSSEPSRGHLTAIAAVPFKSIVIDLSDGSSVGVRRSGDVADYTLEFRISKGNETKAVYHFVPQSSRERYFQEQLKSELYLLAPKSKEAVAWSRDKVFGFADFSSKAFQKADSEESYRAYIAALKALKISPVLMATDRSVKSDALDSDRLKARVVQEAERTGEDIIAKIRGAYLRDAIDKAEGYLRKRIIEASNVGSRNTNDTFTELISKIAQDHFLDEHTDLNADLNAAVDKLLELEIRTRDLAGYGISPELNFKAIIQSIRAAPPKNVAVLEKLLSPYIEGVNVRLQALEPIADVIKTFLGILNGLLKYKRVRFTPAQGIVIEGSHGSLLEVSKLSSGEQQLLLMFCVLLASAEKSSILIIDEPEISLNVKWQRELIAAMRKIKAENGQIILATHSVELLAQYSDMVIRLAPTVDLKFSSEDDQFTSNH